MPAIPEKIVSTTMLYSGHILNLEKVQAELADGRLAAREVIRHKQAVVVLIKRPDGKFVFVRQFRIATGGFLLEAVAGGMEDGETPQEAALREASEESGYDVTDLKYLGNIYSSPGFCDELLHCFFAQTSGDMGAQHPDADESLDVVHLAEAEFSAMVKAGDIHDSKTLAAWALYRSVSGD